MGEYVAHCMYGGTDELSLGFNFEVSPPIFCAM